VVSVIVIVLILDASIFATQCRLPFGPRQSFCSFVFLKGELEAGPVIPSGMSGMTILHHPVR
jgi:hypothetical protein